MRSCPRTTPRSPSLAGMRSNPGAYRGETFYRHAPEVDSLIYLGVANSDGSGYRPLVIANLSEDGES